MTIRSVTLAASLLLSGAALAQEMDLQVELMGPLGTKTSRKGDRVFARVAQPGALKGDTLEGTVTEVRSGNKLRGNSALNFSFDTLRHGGQAVQISTQIKSFQNSRGQADVDEEGRVIRRGGGNTGKAAAGTAAGGLIGGIKSGLKGAAIGAGVGAVASIAIIEIASDAPEIRFAPGSVITLSAKSRSGPALNTLTSAPAPPSESTVPPVAATPAPAAATARAATPAPSPAAAGTAPAGASAQPDMVNLKADFITGEKTLFYDDFTDMAPDDAPPHWKVRGASLTLQEGGGVRQATVATDTTRMTPLFTGFPKNFTLEMDVKYEGFDHTTWAFFAKGKTDNQDLQVWTETRGDKAMRVQVRTPHEIVADIEGPCDLTQPVKQAIWVQNGRVRFYCANRKLVDANQIELPPLETALLTTQISGKGKVGYRLIRIAESTPDFSHSIASTGRYVTYGILFDTDSDHLKPESAAVIKSIASGLQANPDLKLRIEGHTDSTGGDDHNRDLSRRRAEAVKSVLVAQFQVDAARLTAEGMGATKPVAANDTPQGRSQNRRVEFVKQ